MFKIILSTLLLCIGAQCSSENGLLDITGFEGPQGRFFFNYPWFPLPGITLRPSGTATAGGVCSATAVATAPCTCGTMTCQVGQACTVATSTCAVPTACTAPLAAAIMTPIPAAPCTCGATLCPITSYCSSAMVCTPVTNVCAATTSAAMNPCRCGTTTFCLGAAVACAIGTGVCT